MSAERENALHKTINDACYVLGQLEYAVECGDRDTWTTRRWPWS